jgi:hydroxymethylbilane synthase
MTNLPYSSKQPLRIGTRGSPLALAQAEELKRRLGEAHPALRKAGAVEISVIKTTGDKVQDRKLMEIGGKGLFTKEIEEALLAGTVDCAIHSAKDMETWLPEGLIIGCILPREDPRDALFAKKAKSIADLPKGAVVGTSSLRRQAQLLARRPDLKVVSLRGNVETRLKKLAAGEVDATLLALAGLKRLGLAEKAKAVLSTDEILPAVAQGALAIEVRADNQDIRAGLAPLNDAVSERQVTAERACLAELDGSCHTPIAALAEPKSDGATFRLRALIALPDGSKVHDCDWLGSAEDPQALGKAVGAALKGAADPSFFKAQASSKATSP